jgi:pimeloyl-ACP methyl ester carboxylesterase
MSKQAKLLIAMVVGALALPAPAVAAPQTFAEPDSVVLAGALAAQELVWQDCGSSFPLDQQEWLKLACATVTVPRDWHNPQDGHTLQVRISRTHATGGRKGILMVNPGGPGGSGLELAPGLAIASPTVSAFYDIVGFDPRGVGQSTRLWCSVTYDSEADVTELLQADVEGCRGNELTKFITTEQTTYDMDFIRALLGEEKLNYLGYSYGTWLGTWYAATFSSRVGKMILDSVAAVASPTLQETWDLQPLTRDRAFQEQLMPYIARHDDIYGRGTDPLAIRQLWERAGGTRIGIGWFMFAFGILPALYNTEQYHIAAAAVDETIRYYERYATPATEQSTPEQLLADMTARLLARPEIGEAGRAYLRETSARAAEALKQAAIRQAGDKYTYEIDLTFEVIRCQDGQWNQSLGYWTAFSDRLERTAPLVAPFMRTPPRCAFWPTTSSMPKIDSKTFPQVLMLQSELDVATAYEGALAAARHLPGARMISVDNEGSHGVFPYYTNCVDDAVFALLLDGELPREQFTACSAAPLPGETEVFEVGGSLQPKGTVATQLVSDDMRAANKMLKRLLRTEPDPVYPE